MSCSIRLASTADAGRNNSKSRIGVYPSFPCRLSPRPLLSLSLFPQRGEHLLRRDRQRIDPYADRVKNRVGNSASNWNNGGFAGALCAKGAIRLHGFDNGGTQRWRGFSGRHCVIGEVAVDQPAVLEFKLFVKGPTDALRRSPVYLPLNS